jgi:hypothetical protein
MGQHSVETTDCESAKFVFRDILPHEPTLHESDPKRAIGACDQNVVLLQRLLATIRDDKSPVCPHDYMTSLTRLTPGWRHVAVGKDPNEPGAMSTW